MRRIEPILAGLDSARRRLLSEVEGMQDPRFGARPPGGGWSAAQVFEHLARAEEKAAGGIVAVSAGKLKVEVRPLDYFRWLIYRSGIYSILTARTTAPLDPAEGPARADAFARIAASRSQLLAAIEAGERRGLWSHRLRHPIFGPLKIAEMLEFLAYHEERHRLQIVRIKAALERAGR